MELIKFRQCATCFIVLILWSYLNSTLAYLITITGQLLVTWTLAWYLARFYRTTLRPLILPLVRDIEAAAGKQRPQTATTAISETKSTTNGMNGSSNGTSSVPHSNGNNHDYPHYKPHLPLNPLQQSVEDELYVRPAGRAVLITGCDAGIGLDLALQLAEKGFTIFAGCQDWYGRGAQTLEEHAKSKGLKIQVLKLDVTKDEDVATCLIRVKKSLGNDKLWAYCHTVNIARFLPLEFGSPGLDEVWEAQMDVNALGLVRILRPFLPLLRRSKGSRIILVNSLSGRLATFPSASHSMSTFAVRAFGDAVRREMKPFGVHVSIVEPTLYQTPLLKPEWHLKYFGKKWEEMPESVASDYGTKRFQELLDGLKGYLGLARKRPQEVVSTLIHCVTTTNEPEYYYRCCGIFDRLCYWTTENLLPEELQDYVLSGTGQRWFNAIFKERF